MQLHTINPRIYILRMYEHLEGQNVVQTTFLLQLKYILRIKEELTAQKLKK